MVTAALLAGDASRIRALHEVEKHMAMLKMAEKRVDMMPMMMQAMLDQQATASPGMMSTPIN